METNIVCGMENFGESLYIKTLSYSRGIQAALELVLKTSRTVKRMGIDTSPYYKIINNEYKLVL